MVQQAMDTFGRLDIVVNNAGILRDKMIFNMTEEEWDIVLAVHLKGHFNLSKHAAVIFRQQRSGVFVNTASESGLGNRGQGNYAAAKEGIIGLSRTLARDMGGYGVRSNAIRPRAGTRLVISDEMREAAQRGGAAGMQGFQALEAFGKANPPDAVGPFVAWLCTDAAANINGRDFMVSGPLDRAVQPARDRRRPRRTSPATSGRSTSWTASMPATSPATSRTCGRSAKRSRRRRNSPVASASVADARLPLARRQARIGGPMANPFASAPWFHKLGHATNTMFWRALPTPTGLGVLTTTGRRTGKQRVRALRVIRDGNRLYGVAMLGPKCAWLHNIRAHPDVRIKLGSKTHNATARELTTHRARGRFTDLHPERRLVRLRRLRQPHVEHPHAARRSSARTRSCGPAARPSSSS